MAERHTWKRRLAAALAGGIFLAGSACALAAPVELSLDDSIALALKNNPTIKIAEAGKEKSRWGIDQAQAGAGFVLNYAHSDKRYDTPPSPTGFPTYTYTNLFNNQLSLGLPIYTGGKLEGLIDQAKLTYQVSDLNVDATRQQLRLSATTSYFNVLATRNLLEVAKQSVTDFEAHLKNVQAQYDVGTVARSDVLQTQVQLANAQDNLIKADNNYNLAVANLNNVIGLPLSGEIKLKEDLKYQQYPLTLNALTLAANQATNRDPVVTLDDDAVLTAIDVENRRISLSIQEFRPNEWEEFASKHEPGDVVDGNVAKVADFGVFVRLPEGLEGLMHVSETPLPRGERPGNVYHEGDPVRVRILRIEPAEQRIGLSSRDVEQPEPASPEEGAAPPDHHVPAGTEPAE